jgi:hypothetical protein
MTTFTEERDPDGRDPNSRVTITVAKAAAKPPSPSVAETPVSPVKIACLDERPGSVTITTPDNDAPPPVVPSRPPDESAPPPALRFESVAVGEKRVAEIRKRLGEL